jgi:hypothetical protein
MATKTASTGATEMRRCIGRATFGIEPHDAPVADFPVQPSQKDGLGRMCQPQWRQETNALRRAALARKATEAEAAPEAEPEPVTNPRGAAAGPVAPRQRSGRGRGRGGRDRVGHLPGRVRNVPRTAASRTARAFASTSLRSALILFPYDIPNICTVLA